MSYSARTTLLLLALPRLAFAAGGEILEGDFIRAQYNQGGVWNSNLGGESSGLQVRYDSNGSGTLTTADAWTDVTFPGTPHAAVVYGYTWGGSATEHYADYAYSTYDWSPSMSLTSSGTRLSIVHTWTDGPLRITKTESWEDSEALMHVDFVLTNTTTSEVTDARSENLPSM